MSAALPTAAQIIALMLLGLVAGSMFGIWRGYDITGYAPATFVEVYQGAVRGLNTLLPAMAAGALVLVIVLAIMARNRPAALGLYVAAAIAIIAGGAITRLLNQPINDQIMAWTPTTIPTDWSTMRDSWWTWHLVRLTATLAGLALLIAAVFVDREG